MKLLLKASNVTIYKENISYCGPTLLKLYRNLFKQASCILHSFSAKFKRGRTVVPDKNIPFHYIHICTYTA